MEAIEQDQSLLLVDSGPNGPASPSVAALSSNTKVCPNPWQWLSLIVRRADSVVDTYTIGWSWGPWERGMQKLGRSELP